LAKEASAKSKQPQLLPTVLFSSSPGLSPEASM
jgi:hypothetical protein